MGDTGKLAFERWIARRDAEAFKAVASLYSRMVYGTCCRILGNATEAEDVTQECFEALAQAESAPRDYVGPWLHRVATNLCLKRIRSERRRKTREMKFAAEQASRTEIEWDDIYEYVDEAIEELPEKLRAPLVAHYLEDLSHAAIAQALRVPRSTVSNRIAKGLQIIGRSLRRRGLLASTAVLASLFSANLAKAGPVPATLTVSLGKLALSFAASPISHHGGSATVLQGFFGLHKQVIGAVVAAVLLGAAALVVFKAPDRTTVSDADELQNDKIDEAVSVLPKQQEDEAARAGDEQSTVASTSSAPEQENVQTQAKPDDLMAYIFEQQNHYRSKIRGYAYEGEYEFFYKRRPGERELKAIRGEPEVDESGRFSLPVIPPRPAPRGFWTTTETGFFERVQSGEHVYATRSSEQMQSVGYVVANEHYVAWYGQGELPSHGKHGILAPQPGMVFNDTVDERGRRQAEAMIDEMTVRFDPLLVMYGTGQESLKEFVARIGPSRKEVWQEGDLYYIKLIGPKPATALRTFMIDGGKGFAITRSEYETKDSVSRSERSLVLREVVRDIWFPIAMDSARYMPARPLQGEDVDSGETDQDKRTIRLRKVCVNLAYPDSQFRLSAFGDAAQKERFYIHKTDGTVESGILSGDRFLTEKDGDLYLAAQGFDVDRSQDEIAAAIEKRAQGSERIAKKLRSKITASFDNTSVDSAVEFIGDYKRMDFRIDEEAIPDPGDAVVNMVDLSGFTLHEILETMLTPLGLDYTYVPDGDYILITTPEKISSL